MNTLNHLANALRTASLDRDDAPFAYRPGVQTVSYKVLWEQAARYAATLVAAGVLPGDRVAVQIEKSSEAIELYLGTILAGGVFLPLNTAYTPTEIEYFLRDAEPTVFVCDPSRLEALKTIASKSGTKAVLTLDEDGSGSLPDKAKTQASGFAAIERSENDLAAILYTSGTTGRSKGAMLTHGNLASNASCLRDYWQFTKDDVLIHALPIFHTHGLFVATNVTLMAGSSVIFLTKFDTDQILKLMAGATVLMGVPTFFTRLLKHPDLSPETTQNIRLFVSGSAPLLEETHLRWQERTGHTILERYGMTETNMNTSNPYDGKRLAGTVGFALPGVKVRITDTQSGEELPQGEIGSIEVCGPNVFKGYWRMPEKTREELRDDGFFLTGDLGVIDDEGYVSIVGRSKDLIISGGYNVYPKEIEVLIDDLNGVAESSVIGLPHPDFGEGVAAVIVLQSDAALTAEDILRSTSIELARFKQPKRIYFVDELPRNSMGKVQKNVLREKFGTAFQPKA